MKSKYKRKAWYLYKDVLLEGYVDKYGFHPNKTLHCDFDLKKISRKDIGKTVFYDIDATPWEIFSILS